MLTKMRNKKGFTLMEMLIVIAIIAVLVAIAIPTFSGALTKAKQGADVANIRALYAEWQIAMLTDEAGAPSDAGSTSPRPRALPGCGSTSTVTPSTWSRSTPRIRTRRSRAPTSRGAGSPSDRRRQTRTSGVSSS